MFSWQVPEETEFISYCDGPYGSGTYWCGWWPFIHLGIGLGVIGFICGVYVLISEWLWDRQKGFPNGPWNPFRKDKSSVLVGDLRWPIPVWDIRWIWADPIRRDIVLSTAVGTGVGALFVKVPDTRTGLIAIGIPFGICFGLQILRGLNRFGDWLTALGASSFGSIKVLAFWASIAAAIAAMVMFPWIGVLVALVLFAARFDALMARADLGLLLFAAVIWVAGFLSAVLLYRWPVVPIVLFSVLGLFSGFFAPQQGFRVGRMPTALFESTTLVFGIVLGGLSLVRTAIILAGTAPSTSHLESLTNGRPNPMHGSRGLTLEDMGGVPKNQNYVHVGGYFRTVADGDPTNNFSFGGRQVNRNVEFVRAHIRTAPDGVVENNLSYRAPTVDLPGGPPTAYAAVSPSVGKGGNVLVPSRPDHLALISGVLAVASSNPNPVLIEDIRFRARRNFLWRPFLAAPVRS